MDFTNPLDIFNEGLFTAKEMADAKARGVPGDRHSPAVAEIKAILNRIINTQTTSYESWDIMTDVLKAFSPEIRTYIYKQSMKKEEPNEQEIR